MATILILDNDLGFAFWLGQTLNAPHCTALPAFSVADASEMIRHFDLKVDFLIMNPAVPGGEEFTRALRKEQRQMRVATLKPPGGSNASGVNALEVPARESLDK